MWWPLTLTYISKVILPWLRKSCPLCSVYSSTWILFIFGTNDHYHWRVCRVLRFFFQNLEIWIFGIFKKIFGLDLEKISTDLDEFFPYLSQMITSVRGCVAYNDLWPWPISSRSFGLGLENCVRSVASTVPDGFFPYLVQMITSMRRCVACDELWPWPISSRSFGLDLENCVRSVASWNCTGGNANSGGRYSIHVCDVYGTAAPSPAMTSKRKWPLECIVFNGTWRRWVTTWTIYKGKTCLYRPMY